MAATLYELDVRLRHISPPIWRTIEVAGSSTLEDVHFAIQIAMGWTNSHLHQFTVGKASYGMVHVHERPGLRDERAVRLEELAKQGDKLVYKYDFGDDWEHDITIKCVTNVAKPPRPRCTAGQRACPPEDCGGPGGYQQMLEVLADPTHPDYADVTEWIDEPEPERFDLPKAGRDLGRAMNELKALGEQDGHADGDAGDAFDLGLPKPLVEAVLALDPMQRASLVTVIAGSLVEDVFEAHAATAHLIEGLKRQHKPVARHRRGRART